jgi:outer membrane lipoprotein SlyB
MVANGAISGGVSGATIGSAVLPGWGTAIGGAAGALIGGIGGAFADDANQEAQNADPEYQAQKRRERSRVMMSAALGRAFSSMKAPKISSFSDPISGAPRGI